MEENKNKLYCNICDKKYASYNSFWYHNNKYHNNDINSDNITIDKSYSCNYCNNKFKFRQSKWKHEKDCNQKNIINNTNKIILLDKEIELTKLKIKLQNGKKINNKTFQFINKILMDKAYQNNINIQNNIQNNINIQNNYKIIGFGKEVIIDALTLKEKKLILQEKLCCIDKCIEITNIENHNEFKNIIITNLKDNYAYKFDDNKGYFIVCSKTDVLNELISNRVIVIEEIYDELSLTNKIGDYTKQKIKDFLIKINEDNKPFIDENEEIKYSNYKDYKINKIKILLYNNQDKITKDIASLIIENIIF